MNSNHPDALAYVFEVWRKRPSRMTQNAARSLTRILSSIYHSKWPEVAWQFSSLTGSGFPVELGFTAGDAAIRYTTEVGAPEIPNNQRILAAQQLLTQLGSPTIPDALYHPLQTLQQGGPLAYGAWISGRHTNQSNRFKVYIEVPQTNDVEINQFLSRYLPFRMPHCNGVPSLRMVGVDPVSKQLELYYRSNKLESYQLHHLLKPIGLQHQYEAFATLIYEMCRNRWREQLPGTSIGFSYTLSQSHKPSIFSLFTTARALCGGDGACRQHIQAIATKKGWELPFYRDITSRIQNKTGWQTAHGMVSFVTGQGFDPLIHVGVCPAI